jgi:hypothetical protein
MAPRAGLPWSSYSRALEWQTPLSTLIESKSAFGELANRHGDPPEKANAAHLLREGGAAKPIQSKPRSHTPDPVAEQARVRP